MSMHSANNGGIFQMIPVHHLPTYTEASNTNLWTNIIHNDVCASETGCLEDERWTVVTHCVFSLLWKISQQAEYDHERVKPYDFV